MAPTTFTNFNFETVDTATLPDGYGLPTLALNSGSSGEVAITCPVTNNTFKTMGLDDWTEPIGGTVWTKHTVTPA
jgi:hypothetical protein